MACGTPVVAGDAPAVNEIAKGVALLVPPNDWLALANALEQVLTDGDLAEDLRRRGLSLAASFTWERTANLTWQVYRRFVESWRLNRVHRPKNFTASFKASTKASISSGVL
jgi:alpha-1,3-rhamnosyl/mannosyltransferase